MSKIKKVQENKDLESIRSIFIDYFKNVHFLRDNKYIYNMILDINDYNLYLYLLSKTMLDCNDEDNILKDIEPFLKKENIKISDCFYIDTRYNYNLLSEMEKELKNRKILRVSILTFILDEFY
jgi:hypothetical protein